MGFALRQDWDLELVSADGDEGSYIRRKGAPDMTPSPEIEPLFRKDARVLPHVYFRSGSTALHCLRLVPVLLEEDAETQTWIAQVESLGLVSEGDSRADALEEIGRQAVELFLEYRDLPESRLHTGGHQLKKTLLQTFEVVGS